MGGVREPPRQGALGSARQAGYTFVHTRRRCDQPSSLAGRSSVDGCERRGQDGRRDGYGGLMPWTVSAFSLSSSWLAAWLAARAASLAWLAARAASPAAAPSSSALFPPPHVTPGAARG